MKRLFNTSHSFTRIFLLLVALSILSCAQNKDQGTFFGERFETEQAQTLADFLSATDLSVNEEMKLSATIEEVCQKKGCWMTLKTEDGSNVRVTFKDYGFFVPMDAMGKEIVLIGTATKKELDQATLDHYAEDAGKPVETMSSNEISIVASGVLIL